MNRLSGRGKSEENKGRDREKRRGGTLRSLIYFRAFSPPRSLFTGYGESWEVSDAQISMDIFRFPAPVCLVQIFLGVN